MEDKKGQFNKGEIVIYKPSKNEVKLKVRFENETVWLSLDQIANLFGRDKSVISRHLRNIFKEGEIVKKSVGLCVKTGGSYFLILSLLNPP